MLFNKDNHISVGWDTVVAIAFRYGLDGRGNRMPVRARYSATVQTDPETRPASL
jgi:hypothetical protein